MDFSKSGKNNPCTVCGRVKDSDCRSRESGNLVLCHTFQEGGKDEIVNGFKYVGRSEKGAGWGIWIFDVSSGDVKPLKSRPIKASKTDYFYPDRSGNPLARVQRVERPGEGKKFFQYHFADGNWVAGMPDQIKRQIPIYRYEEVREAIASKKTIFWVEGEGVADSLWELDIPATTTIGGGKGYRSYGDYSNDLKGATIVLCPDRDEEGIKYVEEIEKDYPDSQWCYVYPKSPNWAQLPKNNGLDATDWINEGATLEHFINAVEPKRGSKPPETPKKKDSSSALDSPEWDEFQGLISKLVEAIDNPLEQEFRLRRLCQQFNMPIGFGQQVKQLVTGSVKQFKPMCVLEFLAQHTEDRQWLIAGHVSLGIVMNLCAPGGSGKTTLALEWVKHVALGQRWNNFRVHQGKVLIIEDDEPETDTREKLDIARFYDLPPECCAIEFQWQFTQLEDLEAYIKEHDIRLCLIDSLGSTNLGLDRDKPAFADNLKRLRNIANNLGCTFIVLDHTNKAGSQLGTVAVRNTVSEMVYLLHPTEEEKRMYSLNSKSRILWYDKSRSGLTDTKMVLQQRALDYSWEHLGLLDNVNLDAIPISKQITKFIEDGEGRKFTVSAVRNEFGLEYEKTELELEQLRRSGMIDSEWVIHGSDRFRVYYFKTPGAVASAVAADDEDWREF